jgi:hypothetical protein
LRDAEVMVLGRHGYETAVKGKNAFVCMVWRSWAAGIDDPEFWNPKLRAPVCLNRPAVRFNIPLTLKRTELVLAGRTKTQVFADITAAFDKKEIPAAGARRDVLHALQTRLPKRPRRSLASPPDVFRSTNRSRKLGRRLAGLLVVAAFTGTPERHTVFLVSVPKWSDGSPAPMDEH